MRIVYTLCGGLDVHQRTVTACLLKWGAQGRTVKEVRTFATTTGQLLQLADWLTSHDCQHVAMESTGVYWKPVHNILAGVCREVLLVNAQHVKTVPGRKTDVKDAEWIAELLSYGLLRGSFVPPPEIRELRELTRYRTTLIRQRAEVIIAEIGVNMQQFPTAAHLASWAAICPGNRESGGKRLSGRTRAGNPWLKSALAEAGWAASHTKNTYLAARFHHVARRRGRKRAVLAVGHTILKIAHRLLSDPDTTYHDLGPDYFAPPSKDRLAQSLLRRLGKLGYKVHIETTAA